MDDFSTKKWYLSMDREVKLKLLEDMVKDKEFGYYFQVANWLLDTPISKGGIETETIKKILDKG